jgi:hypothetical protein
MKFTILELFDAFKKDNPSVADVHLETLTNESGLLTADIFVNDLLHEFMETLSNNNDIEFRQEDKEDPVFDVLTQIFSWTDYNKNSLIVKFHNESDEALLKIIFRGYTIEYKPSTNVTAKKGTFSAN